MPAAQEIPTPPRVAVILNQPLRENCGARIAISTAVSGFEPTITTPFISSRDALCMEVLDQFITLWSDHGADGITLYVADPIVQKLLIEQSARFPGLVVRSVVTGTQLTETWQACRQSLSQATKQLNEPSQQPRQIVVATDASKQYGKNLVGLAAVSSTGAVRYAHTNTNSVLEAELAAISIALDQWGERVDTLDILTDSRAAYRHLNDMGSLRNLGKLGKECIEKKNSLTSQGIAVNVHWIRGHHGNPLNELADRMAVSTRRCEQWSLHAQKKEFADRIRSELRETLSKVDPFQLIPTAKTVHEQPAGYDDATVLIAS